MSELPRTDELARSEEEYDVASVEMAPVEVTRVEEAFASFADRVHELESVAAELRAELRALRSERQERPASRFESEEWPADGAAPSAGLAPSPDWVSSVPAPLAARPVAVPRLAVEAIFLVLVALLAGLADLSTTSIAIVMAVAWALVVLSEWIAAAKRSRWHLDAVATPIDDPGAGVTDSTGPWSMPIAEATVIEAPEVSESHTVVTKLPPERMEPQPQEAEPQEAEAQESEPRESERAPELVPLPESEPAPEPEDEPEPDLAAEAATAEPEAPEHEPAEADGSEPAGAETSIPPALEGDEPDSEPGPEPKRRFGLFRRKQRAEDPASETPDPWEL